MQIVYRKWVNFALHYRDPVQALWSQIADTASNCPVSLAVDSELCMNPMSPVVWSGGMQSGRGAYPESGK